MEQYEYTFEVPGKPHGQMRARATVRYDRSGKPHSHVYKDNRQLVKEHDIARQIIDKAPRIPHTGTIGIQVRAFYPIPPSWPKKKQLMAETGQIRPYKEKPDLDNVMKHIKDVMTGLFYVDDKQVCSESITKVYGLKPRVYIALLCENAQE